MSRGTHELLTCWIPYGEVPLEVGGLMLLEGSHRKADRLKLIYWDGSGIVMAYKRLEEHTFTWPGIKDGLMTLTHAQFEALFAGLDWRRVHAVQTRAPEAIE